MLLGAFVLVALVGPLVAPYSPTLQSLDHLLESPSRAHWLGTDENGCDVLSEMLHGARLAAWISLLVTTISLLVGIAFGTVAGYFGGLLDDAMMRVVDILLAFPGILLNLAIVALVPRPGAGHLVFALAVNGWVGYARVARGEVLRLREREFVQAARAIGASPWRVMARHVAPNILTPLVVQATFGFAGVILVEASLSFLGIGRMASYSWGSMLAQGTTYLWRTQHLALAPGLCIAAVVLGCNLLGDGLRDHLDPRRVRR
ncbi:MAG: ABC transporter permease [Myxococcales bacterium]|nr:ABC transporter permease [Myxococcales bacterium]